MKDKRVLAIIPARFGSKRLPQKNILSFCGKPLIAWSISEALKVGDISKVVVSTDSEDIAKISKSSGAEVPFLRPSSLASDTASTLDVIFHCIDSLENAGEYYDTVITLQPTSPLRNSTHIKEALELYNGKGTEFVSSVCEMEHPVQWCGVLDEDNSFKHFNIEVKRSQDLRKHFRLNGAIYIMDVEALKEKRKISYTDSSYAYCMDVYDSIDIDNMYDFIAAEALFKHKECNRD